MAHAYIANFCDHGAYEAENDERFDAAFEEMASPQFVRLFAKMGDNELDQLKSLAVDHLLNTYGDELHVGDGTIGWAANKEVFAWYDDGWKKPEPDEYHPNPVVEYRNLRLMVGDELVLMLIIQKTELL